MAAVLAAWHAEHFDGPDLREHLSRFLLPGNRKPVPSRIPDLHV